MTGLKHSLVGGAQSPGRGPGSSADSCHGGQAPGVLRARPSHPENGPAPHGHAQGLLLQTPVLHGPPAAPAFLSRTLSGVRSGSTKSPRAPGPDDMPARLPLRRKGSDAHVSRRVAAAAGGVNRAGPARARHRMCALRTPGRTPQTRASAPRDRRDSGSGPRRSDGGTAGVGGGEARPQRRLLGPPGTSFHSRRTEDPPCPWGPGAAHPRHCGPDGQREREAGSAARPFRKHWGILLSFSSDS